MSSNDVPWAAILLGWPAVIASVTRLLVSECWSQN